MFEIRNIKLNGRGDFNYLTDWLNEHNINYEYGLFYADATNKQGKVSTYGGWIEIFTDDAQDSESLVFCSFVW